MGTTLKQYDFNERLNFSKIGTEKIIQYYAEKGEYLHSVEDIEKFYKHDIDLVLKEGSKLTTIEVKVDSYKSGNFFLEIMSNKEKKTLGCLLTTKANKLFYYFINLKKLYIFDRKRLKDWIIKNKVNYRKVETSTPVGDEWYTTVGLVVSIPTLTKELKPEEVDV